MPAFQRNAFQRNAFDTTVRSTLGDTTSVADDLDFTTTGIIQQNLLAEPIDTSTATDSLSSLAGRFRTVSDTRLQSDSIIRRAGRFRFPQETLPAITESFNKKSRSPVETLTLFEAIGVVHTVTAGQLPVGPALFGLADALAISSRSFSSGGSVPDAVDLGPEIPAGTVDDFNRTAPYLWGQGALGWWQRESGTATNISVSGGMGVILASGVMKVYHPMSIPIELVAKMRLPFGGSEANLWVNWTGALFEGAWGGLFFDPGAVANRFSVFDVRDISTTDNFDRSDVGLPDHSQFFWVRLLVTAIGMYARIWADGASEPVMTSPVTPPEDGRGETWQAYEQWPDDTRDPLMPFDVIIVQGQGNRFEIDYLEVVDG